LNDALWRLEDDFFFSLVGGKRKEGQPDLSKTNWSCSSEGYGMVPAAHTMVIADGFEPATARVAIALIEEHELTAANMVIHPWKRSHLRSWNEGSGEFKIFHERNSVPFIGSFHPSFCDSIQVNVFCSTMCPRNTCFLFADPQSVGAMYAPEEAKYEVAETGWGGAFRVKASREVSFIPVNDYATAKIVFPDSYSKCSDHMGVAKAILREHSGSPEQYYDDILSWAIPGGHLDVVEFIFGLKKRPPTPKANDED